MAVNFYRLILSSHLKTTSPIKLSLGLRYPLIVHEFSRIRCMSGKIGFQIFLHFKYKHNLLLPKVGRGIGRAFLENSYQFHAHSRSKLNTLLLTLGNIAFASVPIFNIRHGDHGTKGRPKTFFHPFFTLLALA